MVYSWSEEFFDDKWKDIFLLYTKECCLSWKLPGFYIFCITAFKARKFHQYLHLSHPAVCCIHDMKIIPSQPEKNQSRCTKSQKFKKSYLHIRTCVNDGDRWNLHVTDKSVCWNIQITAPHISLDPTELN